MLNYVTASSHDEFVVGTESGILYRMMQANPGKKFYLLQPEILCADMKKLTLADVERALRTMEYQVELPADTIEASANSIKLMLDVK